MPFAHALRQCVHLDRDERAIRALPRRDADVVACLEIVERIAFTVATVAFSVSATPDVLALAGLHRETLPSSAVMVPRIRSVVCA